MTESTPTNEPPDAESSCIRVGEFELDVFLTERVKLVVRAPAEAELIGVASYGFNQPIADDTPVEQWYKTRIAPLLKESEFTAAIVDGVIGTRTLQSMETVGQLRQSYVR